MSRASEGDAAVERDAHHEIECPGFSFYKLPHRFKMRASRAESEQILTDTKFGTSSGGV